MTTKDSAILKFSKNISAMVKNRFSGPIDQNLCTGMVLHEALTLYGISYNIDPTTPYKEFSKHKLALDFLQFPRQTLEFKAGDCDDLSILYSALLEAVGIETAFITVPGHIFMAFSLNIKPEELKKTLRYPEDLIVKDDKAWIAVEITRIGDGFLKAWEMGARGWRESDGRGQTGFFLIYEAWEIYEPVGFIGGDADISLPAEQLVVEAYQREINRFVEREITSRVEKLRQSIEKTGGSPRARNRLGVLYARYGLDDKALQEFTECIADREYLPALVNLGNLHFLREDMGIAMEYYERAAALAPDNLKVLIGLARTNYALENFGTAGRTYRKLQKLDADLASRFAYMEARDEEAVRASEASRMRGLVVWEEE